MKDRKICPELCPQMAVSIRQSYNSRKGPQFQFQYAGDSPTDVSMIECVADDIWAVAERYQKSLLTEEPANDGLMNGDIPSATHAATRAWALAIVHCLIEKKPMMTVAVIDQCLHTFHGVISFTEALARIAAEETVH